MPYQTASGYVDAGAGELGAYLGDAAPVYVNWAAQVKQNGGAVVNWPFDDDGTPPQTPAARYPAATYVELYNAGKIDPNADQRASGSNQYIYVKATADVQGAAGALVDPTAREIADLPGMSWNPFANLSTSSKVITAAAAATGLAAILGLFRGRR